MALSKNTLKYLSLALVLMALGSCALFSEDLSQAKSLAAQGQYSEAIALLDSFESGASRKYNSKIRVDYGESILKKLEVEQVARYQEAKAIFEEALKLDPKNKRARVLYLTTLKLTE